MKTSFGKQYSVAFHGRQFLSSSTEAWKKSQTTVQVHILSKMHPHTNKASCLLLNVLILQYKSGWFVLLVCRLIQLTSPFLGLIYSVIEKVFSPPFLRTDRCSSGLEIVLCSSFSSRWPFCTNPTLHPAWLLCLGPVSDAVKPAAAPGRCLLTARLGGAACSPH